MLLPGIAETPVLPLFLRGNTWVKYSGGLHDATARSRLYWGITGRQIETEIVEPTADVIPDTVHRVFLANALSGGIRDLFDNIVKPALTDIVPIATPEDLSDGNTAAIAHPIEDGVAQAQIVIFILSAESPFVPLSLQSSLPADKKLIVLLEGGIELPDVLAYGEVLKFRHSNKALEKLRLDLKLIVSAALEGDRLAEAEKLLRLGFPESAVIAAANHLYDFLRNHAVAHFGYKYFREKPIRYYTMSELFRLLFKNGKLQTHTDGQVIEWRKLVELRNVAAHGTSRRMIDADQVACYIQTVRQIVRLNAE